MITGKKLIRQRQRLGISQAQVARTAGVDPAYICRIEKEKQVKTLHRIERILNAYGFEIMPIGGMTVEEANEELKDWNDFDARLEEKLR